MTQHTTAQFSQEMHSVLYSTDEERMRALIILLNKSLLIGAAMVFLIAAIAQWHSTIYIAMGNFFLYLFFLFYLRQGHIRVPGIATVLVLLGSVSYSIYNGDGARDVAIMIYPIVLLIGALIFNRLYFILLTMLSMISYLGIALAEYNGVFTNAYSDQLEVPDVLLAAILMLMSGIIIRLLIEYSTDALQRAAKTEHQFSEILNSLYDAIIILDADDRRIVDVNRTMLNMFGYQREDVQSFTLDMLTGDSEEFSNEAARGHFDKSVTEGTANFRWLAKKRDGSLFWVDVSLKVTRVDDVDRIVVIVRDIDAQRRMEEQLKQAEKLTAIGQLAGGIAHDFNNMLAGIMGAAEVLASRNEKDEDREMIDLIVNTSQQAADLTGKLLSFSKKRHMIFEAVSMKEVVEEVTSILRRSIDRRIRVTVHVDEGPVLVQGDKTQLINLLLNLGINAKDAITGDGLIQYRLGYKELYNIDCERSSFDISPGAYVHISVSDNGSGIPEADCEHIFEPFFSTKSGSRHTGLGLAAAYGITLEHRGAIEVESVEHSGTAFHLYLPLSEHQSDSVLKGPALQQGSGRILIIDDEPVILSTASAMLQRLGYEVVTADSGSKGIDLFSQQHEQIDLVLLDMQMPEKDGSICFRALRETDASVIIVLSSGFSEDTATRALLDEGAAGFIGKPYRLNDLSQIIADALATRHQAK